MIGVTCRSCGYLFTVPASLAGDGIECPNCRVENRVPPAETTARDDLPAAVLLVGIWLGVCGTVAASAGVWMGVLLFLAGLTFVGVCRYIPCSWSSWGPFDF